MDRGGAGVATAPRRSTDRSGLTGLVFDIKRFAIHDGPGIRTTAFLKGCPLSCVWCQNPEGISPRPHLWYHPERCIRCESCVAACPAGALTRQQDRQARDNQGRDARERKQFIHIDRTACTLSGACLQACPTGALEWDSLWYTVPELMKELERDRTYYESSGGGVTLSGGEPLFQIDFAAAILEECRRRDIHTAVETTLFMGRDTLERVRPLIDLFLVDVKLYDATEHRRYTGTDNSRILDNIRYLAATGTALTLRLPLVPGITATEENVAAIGAFASELPGDIPLELVNFNPLPAGKYRALDREWPFPDHPGPLPEDEVARFAGIARSRGARVAQDG